MRSSSLSDENTSRSDTNDETHFSKGKMSSREKNMQILPTKASSIDEESSLPYDYGKSELPPMYVDIQEEIEKNLSDTNTILSQLKKLQA